jgi:FkbM family methyltransferase
MPENAARPSQTPPFGTFPLSAWERRVIGWARSMPGTGWGKRLALWSRRLVPGALKRPVDVEVFGARMRLDARRNVAEKRLLMQPQHFDAAERAALAAHLKPGGTAIDIGANVGAYTLFLAGLVGPMGRVLAVEPQPAVAQRLSVNLAFNPGLAVELAETALGAAEGTALFELNAQNEGESRLARPDAQGTTIQVPVTTLAALLRARGIARLDAAKIDVEGAEPQILVPFFEHAPEALWPVMLVLERVNDRWDMDLMGFLAARGYAVQVQTKLNVVLRRA